MASSSCLNQSFVRLWRTLIKYSRYWVLVKLLTLPYFSVKPTKSPHKRDRRLVVSTFPSLSSGWKLNLYVFIAFLHFLQIQQEFGSFSNYCWSFVNKKPIQNRFRYARQVPVKTPKAEFMSKDLIKRGFRCVGPTVVYSFMQVAGIVNDHLVNCFRYQECDAKIKDDTKLRVEDQRSELLTGALEKPCSTRSWHVRRKKVISN